MLLQSFATSLASGRIPIEMIGRTILRSGSLAVKRRKSAATILFITLIPSNGCGFVAWSPWTPGLAQSPSKIDIKHVALPSRIHTLEVVLVTF